MVRQVVDDVVVTKHLSSMRASDLAARLVAASTDPVRALFAPPLTDSPIATPDGRLLSLEPNTDSAADAVPVPWREAGSLVARLQAIPLPARMSVPEHGGRNALIASLSHADALHPGGSTDILRELGRTLVRTWPTRAQRVLVHGNVHLGTIGRVPGTPTWVFTRPETLGFGDAAWDLGRPAGMWAAGLLDESSWQTFVAGYAEAGGSVPADGQGWDELDHPARSAVYIATVREVVRCGEYPEVALTPLAETLLAACVRMNGRRW